MMTGIVEDQNLEKQIEKHIGCMAGFLNTFDRYQALAGRKRPPPTGLNSAQEMPKVVDSPAIKALPSPDPSWPSPPKKICSPAPEPETPSEEPGTPSETPAARSPFPFPVFKFREGTWSPSKFSKEAPRLSLDNRVTTDAKGSLYPHEIHTNATILLSTRPDKAAREAELRRSASESRVNKDIYRFIEGAEGGFRVNQSQHFNVQGKVVRSAIRKNAAARGNKSSLTIGHDARNGKAEGAKAAHRGSSQRKSYDSTEFFPEPKQAASIYEENEKKPRTRGFDYESSKELDTLNKILEALQPKGLLHSKRNDVNPRNFLYERIFYDDPILFMRQSRSNNLYGRYGSNSPPSSFRSRPVAARRSPGTVSMEASPAASPRRGRSSVSPTQSDNGIKSPSRRRTSVSPTRSDSGIKNPSRRRPLTVESQRRANGVTEPQRLSPVQSPRIGLRRAGLDQSMRMSRSLSPRRWTAEAYQEEEEEEEEEVFISAVDESSTISESSISTPSLTDPERSKMGEYKEGKGLLEGCDKLLQHSITEIRAVAESQQQPSLVSESQQQPSLVSESQQQLSLVSESQQQPSLVSESQQQPSLVSVLNSSFYEESSLHSPITERSIQFEDQAVKLDNDAWSLVSGISCKLDENAGDCDYVYISDILRASSYSSEDSNAVLLLEKQQSDKGKDISRVLRLQRRLVFDTVAEISRPQRRLVFDTVAEILESKKHLVWSKSLAIESPVPNNPSLQQIWSEYQKIRERDTSGNSDMLDNLSEIFRKDLARDAIYGKKGMEMSQVARDVERLIFKDLISETIHRLLEDQLISASQQEAGFLKLRGRPVVY